MDIVKFDTERFEVPSYGIGLSDESLVITFYDEKHTVEELEKLIDGSTQTVNVYEDGYDEVMGTYKGYTKLSSIQKVRNYKKEDGTTGTAFTVELLKPSIQDAIAQNKADIEAINEAIADLANAVGGE